MIIKPWQTEMSVTGGSRKPPLRSKWCFQFIICSFLLPLPSYRARSLSLWRLRDNRYLLPFVLLHCVLTCNLLRHNFGIKKISFRIRSCHSKGEPWNLLKKKVNKGKIGKVNTKFHVPLRLRSTTVSLERN